MECIDWHSLLFVVKRGDGFLSQCFIQGFLCHNTMASSIFLQPCAVGIPLPPFYWNSFVYLSLRVSLFDGFSCSKLQRYHLHRRHSFLLCKEYLTMSYIFCFASIKITGTKPKPLPTCAIYHHIFVVCSGHDALKFLILAIHLVCLLCQAAQKC